MTKANEQPMQRRVRALDGDRLLHRVVEAPDADGLIDFWTVVDCGPDPDAVMEMGNFDVLRPTTTLVTLRPSTPAEVAAWRREQRCAYDAPDAPEPRSWWERVFG